MDHPPKWTIRVESGPAHDQVHVWIDGKKAGTIVVDAGEGLEVERCLRAGLAFRERERRAEGEPVVHGLWHGAAICGDMPGDPCDWPKGHQWAHLDDHRAITCPGCLTALDKATR